ncbi:EamA family transporter [Porphyromonas levii]|uniref:EamA family transporter n=1 Tax=Porphyromonas levii TaxID=28114 RepID=UPI001BAA55EB
MQDSCNKYSHVTLFTKWLFLSSTIVFLPIYWKEVAVTDFSKFDGYFYSVLFYIVVLGFFLPFLLTPIAQLKLRPTVISIYAYIQPFVITVDSYISTKKGQCFQDKTGTIGTKKLSSLPADRPSHTP